MHPQARESVFLVCGVPFEDAPTAHIARMMLTCVLLSTFFVILGGVFSLLAGFYFTGWLWLALLLPFCGYCGTLTRDRAAVGCFSTCSGVVGFVYIVVLIIYCAAVGDYSSCACDDACRENHYISRSDAARICANQPLYSAYWWTSVAFGFTFAGGEAEIRR